MRKSHKISTDRVRMIYGVRHTGLPVGGWYVVDSSGEVVRFGAPIGDMPRRFKSGKVAWRMAEQLSVSAPYVDRVCDLIRQGMS